MQTPLNGARARVSTVLADDVVIGDLRLSPAPNPIDVRASALRMGLRLGDTLKLRRRGADLREVLR